MINVTFFSRGDRHHAVLFFVVYRIGHEGNPVGVIASATYIGVGDARVRLTTTPGTQDRSLDN